MNAFVDPALTIGIPLTLGVGPLAWVVLGGWTFAAVRGADRSQSADDASSSAVARRLSIVALVLSIVMALIPLLLLGVGLRVLRVQDFADIAIGSVVLWDVCLLGMIVLFVLDLVLVMWKRYRFGRLLAIAYAIAMVTNLAAIAFVFMFPWP